MNNETTPNYFIQVPLDMLMQYDLTPTDCLIFGQIYTMLNVTRKCFMSNASIGAKLGIKPNTVQKSISKMKQQGIIKTDLIYKDNSKQVDKRYITINPHDLYHHPHGLKSPTPRDENHGGGGRESTDNRLLNRLDEYISSSKGDADEKTSNDEKKTSSAFTLYEKLWGFPNAIAREDLRNWIKGYSDELVSYAINIAGHNNVSSRGAYKYLSKILENWSNLGIRTVEDAKKQNQEHERRNDREYKQRKSYVGSRIKESMPDYSAKDKQKATSADKAKAAALKERIRKLRENK